MGVYIYIHIYIHTLYTYSGNFVSRVSVLEGFHCSVSCHYIYKYILKEDRDDKLCHSRMEVVVVCLSSQTLFRVWCITPRDTADRLKMYLLQLQATR